MAVNPERSFADVFEAASPSVVTVSAITVDPYRLTNRVMPKLGSGFVVDGGLIVTNSHVVYGASVLVVRSKHGEPIRAKLAGAAPVLDLAVLSIEASAREVACLAAWRPGHPASRAMRSWR
jgi:S1-C subfamily serine protease